MSPPVGPPMFVPEPPPIRPERQQELQVLLNISGRLQSITTLLWLSFAVLCLIAIGAFDVFPPSTFRF